MKEVGEDIEFLNSSGDYGSGITIFQLALLLRQPEVYRILFVFIAQGHTEIAQAIELTF